RGLRAHRGPAERTGDVAGEDLDPVRELQEPLQASVELPRAVDRLDRQVRPRRVAHEERVAREDEPGLLGAGPVDDRETAVLGPVARGMEYLKRHVAEHDLLSVFERVMLVCGLCGRMDGDGDVVLERQAPVAGDVVGVGMRLERSYDS